MNEFELIRKHFAELTPARADVVLGPGDDAALMQMAAGFELAVSTDTLVAGHHFSPGADPYALGWKTLAVSLSDLAAMGAEPLWFLLNLTLVEAQPTWIGNFARGVKELADLHGVGLAGGDITRGPTSLTSTVMGQVESGGAVRRSGAQIGDVICVTGTLGDAALSLRFAQSRTAATQRGGWFRRASDPKPTDANGLELSDKPTDEELAYLAGRLSRPTPRVAEGRILRHWAHAMIDLSDGLAGDLRHVLNASDVGAELWPERFPASAALKRLVPEEQRLNLQAGGGEDYELCACVPPEAVSELRIKHKLPLTMIGQVVEQAGMHVRSGEGTLSTLSLTGFQHFA